MGACEVGLTFHSSRLLYILYFKFSLNKIYITVLEISVAYGGESYIRHRVEATDGVYRSSTPRIPVRKT